MKKKIIMLLVIAISIANLIPLKSVHAGITDYDQGTTNSNTTIENHYEDNEINMTFDVSNGIGTYASEELITALEIDENASGTFYFKISGSTLVEATEETAILKIEGDGNGSFTVLAINDEEIKKTTTDVLTKVITTLTNSHTTFTGVTIDGGDAIIIGDTEYLTGEYGGTATYNYRQDDYYNRDTYNIKFTYGYDTPLVKKINITMEMPKVGTTVTADMDEDGDYIWDTQRPQATITLPEGAHYKLDDYDYEDDEPWNYMYWIEDLDDYKPFVGTFEKGKTYYAEIWLVPEEGYGFSDNTIIYVNGEEIEESELYTDGISVIVPVTPQMEYDVLKGANQTVNKALNETLSFEVDIDYDKFLASGRVYVDDELVDESNYKHKKGSTIITFTPEFTSNLSNGEHTFKVVVDDGEAKTNFTITDSKNPKTGDNVIIYIITLIVSSIGLLTVRKRVNNK